MRVVHGSYSKTRGGAARAASRIFDAIQSEIPNSWFVESASDDRPQSSASHRIEAKLSRWQGSAPGHFKSSAIVPGKAAARIRAFEPDVIHLHWIGKGFMSIEQVATFRTPIVWTLHDMWVFSGTRHYSDGPCTMGWDWLTHWRKEKLWRRPPAVAAPSQWVADLARGSRILGDAHIEVIPNPVPWSEFYPLDITAARKWLDLPDGQPIVGFISQMGRVNHLKGYAALMQAMEEVRNRIPEAHLLSIGNSDAKFEDARQWVHNTGWISEHSLLRSAYSACDIIVVPSMQDNAPQSAGEAAACGRPVIAFDVGGIGGMVKHRETGLLVPAADSGALAAAIIEALDNPVSRAKWGAAARKMAIDRWGPKTIGRQYANLYETAISTYFN